MVQITFVVPYLELEELLEKAFEEYPYKDNIDLSHYYFESQATRAVRFNTEVVIARGLAAHVYSKDQANVPVIEIPITGYDVVRAVAECRSMFNVKKIAIVGTSSIIYGADSIGDILNIEIKCYSLEEEADAEHEVDRAIREGADAIIGGVVACRVACSKGINSVFIKSGKEAIRLSLDEAYRTALITQQERERTERFKTIMEYAYEGIIAIDAQGYITVFNKSAQNLMKVNSEKVIGRDIEDVLPNTKLPRVVKSDQKEIGELQQLGDVLIATNRIPIKVGNETVGAIATFQDVTQIRELEEKIRKKIHPKGLKAKYSIDNIIGTSQAINRVKDMTREFSQVSSNVLIIGETGTGKEIFAQSIHSLSKRCHGPFVAINCAALPESLLESELFGYVEGAFTGASKGGKSGLFELAHNGTIFLDEISELNLELQGRLLRVLQEKEIMRIGHNRVIPIDVRVIAASNKDLKRLVDQGIFRQDLLYRLDVLRISIPPLRERGEDILQLTEFFIKVYNNKFGKNIVGMDSLAKELLLKHDWQGNVRELKNICERLAVLSKNQVIKGKDITQVMALGERKNNGQFIMTKDNPPKIQQNCIEDERELILMTIENCGNNKAEAARRLGINRTTLWRKIKKYNL